LKIGNTVRLSRGGCSCQFGRASAPMIPQHTPARMSARACHRVTGWRSRSPGGGIASRIRRATARPSARILPSVVGSIGSLMRCHPAIVGRPAAVGKPAPGGPCKRKAPRGRGQDQVQGVTNLHGGPAIASPGDYPSRVAGRCTHCSPGEEGKTKPLGAALTLQGRRYGPSSSPRSL
jgi:hypothetical protein